jgi:peptide/nickel transport system ATP-binding protein
MLGAAPLLITESARQTAMPLLQVQGLGKIYPGASRLFRRADPVVAVNDFNLTLDPGEFVGIVGQSGSGKSTVAKLLMGLEQPTSGRILIDGNDVAREDPVLRRLRIDTLQMVFQDPQSALNPRRMVASLITQAMEAGGQKSPWDERLARTRELLKETGLAPEMATRYPSQLSGGQRQRVNIARALCRAPKIIVADEIVSGLDVSVQAQILNLLLRLRDELGIALIFISHDLSVVRYLCRRVLVMHRGDVVESGLTEQVFAHPQHDYTRRLIKAVPPDDPDAPWPPQPEAVGVAA